MSPALTLTHVPLDVLFAHLPDAVYLIDPGSSNIVWCNRAGWESLGLDPKDVLNHSVLSLQKDVHGLPQWSEIATVIRGQACFRFIGRHQHQQGHEIEVEVVTTHFELDSLVYFLSVARDITNRVAHETLAPARQDHQLWFALNEASDGLWDWNVISDEVYVSPQLKRMRGFGPDEMDPHVNTWVNAIHPDDAPRVRALLKAHLAGKSARYEGEYRLSNRNGHYLWVHDRGRVCEHDKHGNPVRVVGMLQDITERKVLEMKLGELAYTDMLTGLANRREGMLFLSKEVALCERLDLPLGIAMIDVDHFKQINDEHGHPAGDEVLRKIGQAIADVTRASDLISRWGGEEFILIAPNTTLPQMTQLAEKLRGTVREHLSPAGIKATVSIGVTAANGAALNSSALLVSADKALYRAKQKGRNRVEAFPSEAETTPSSKPGSRG